MKKLFLYIFLFAVASSHLCASPLADTIGDEVVDSLIEKNIKLIHSNILSKVCGGETYLEFDFGNDKVNRILLSEIKSVAKQRKQEVADIEKVKQQAELLLQAFLDGIQYGAFVARQHQIIDENTSCSAEVVRTVAVSQKELLDTGTFVLKTR